MTASRSRDILALITTDKKHIIAGKAQAFLAESDEACHQLTLELARALQGEVVSLSNGVYLVLNR